MRGKIALATEKPTSSPNGTPLQLKEAEIQLKYITQFKQSAFQTREYGMLRFASCALGPLGSFPEGPPLWLFEAGDAWGWKASLMSRFVRGSDSLWCPMHRVEDVWAFLRLDSMIFNRLWTPDLGSLGFAG